MDKNVYVIKPETKTLDDVTSLARALMDHYDLNDWKFEIRRLKSCVGRIWYGKKTIALMESHVAKWMGRAGDNLTDTVLHEIAHALNFIHKTGKHHDKGWKDWCVKIGADPYHCVQKSRFILRMKDTNEVVGEYLHVPVLPNDIDSVMIEGRPETKGKLMLEMLDEGKYVPAGSAIGKVSLSGCAVERLCLVSKEPEEVTEDVELPDGVRDFLPDVLFAGFKHEQLYRISSKAEGLREAVGEFFSERGIVSPKLRNMLRGDIYAARLKNCVVGARIVDGLGVFALEKKSEIVCVSNAMGMTGMEKREVIRVVSGCVVFDADGDNGYVVSVFNGGKTASPWLEVIPDSKFLINTVVERMKKFVKKECAELSALDKAEMLLSASNYISEEDEFKIDDFVQSVTQGDDDIGQRLKECITVSGDEERVTRFPVTREAAKAATRGMRRVIKLDKNFSIYVHDKTDLVEKAFDPERGMKCYKVYYKEEK